MIASLIGKLQEKETTKLIINVNGVGYEVFIPTNTLSESDIVGNEINLQIVTIVREDVFNLYGFKTKDEKKLFNLLISVNKIGPKTAIGIMSSITPAELQNIILSNNLNALSKLPGIGPKGAAKIILELKDKINQLALTGSESSTTAMLETLSALNTLGYSSINAQKALQFAISEVKDDNPKVEDLIRYSLKFLQK